MASYLCRYRKKKEKKEQEPAKLTCGICGKIQIGGLPYEYGNFRGVCENAVKSMGDGRNQGVL